MILPFAIFASSALSGDCKCNNGEKCHRSGGVKWCYVAKDSTCLDTKEKKLVMGRWNPTKYSYCACGKSRFSDIKCGTGEAEQNDNKEDTDKAPTTSAPVTQAPTTSETVTKAPTTSEPVTKAPVTKAPNKTPETDEPSTKAPTTSAPVTEAPTTSAPVTKAPTTRAPVTEAPVTEAPTTRAPVTKAPVTEAPTTRAPVTEAPVTKTPSIQAPKNNVDKEYLDVHNVLRCTVGLEPFKYDETLGNGRGQKNAQDWSYEMGKFDGDIKQSGGVSLRNPPHSNDYWRLNQGENIWSAWTQKKNKPAATPTEFLMIMWEELPVWLNSKKITNGTGHFTQMAWGGKDQKIRCGRTTWNQKRRRGKSLFYGTYQVCRYSPAGNWYGQEKTKVKDRCVCPLSKCQQYVGSKHITKELDIFKQKLTWYPVGKYKDGLLKRQKFWNDMFSKKCEPENCLDSYKNYSR